MSGLRRLALAAAIAVTALGCCTVLGAAIRHAPPTVSLTHAAAESTGPSAHPATLPTTLQAANLDRASASAAPLAAVPSALATPTPPRPVPAGLLSVDGTLPTLTSGSPGERGPPFRPSQI